jgi:hypothetical protein
MVCNYIRRTLHRKEAIHLREYQDELPNLQAAFLILARSKVIKVIKAIKAIKAAKAAKVATATKVIKVIRGQAMYRNIVLPGVGCHSKKNQKRE